MKSQNSSKVLMILPLGNVDICSEFRGNLSSSCTDISVWGKVVAWLTDITILLLSVAKRNPTEAERKYVSY